MNETMRTKTAEKIEGLFNRIRFHQSGGIAMPTGGDSLSDVLAIMPKASVSETPEASKEAGSPRKSAGQS